MCIRDSAILRVWVANNRGEKQMRLNLERMFDRARSRVHSVYYHQLYELDEEFYALRIRNHRATLARLKAISEAALAAPRGKK